jgi:hypothetical protein
MSNSPPPSFAKNGKEDFHHVEELTSPDSHINVGNDYANNVNAKYTMALNRSYQPR